MIWQGDTQYASPGYLARFQQYNGSGLPLAQFGGYLSVTGGGGDMYNTYLIRYNQVHDDSSPLSMNLESDIIGEQIHLEIEIEVLEELTNSNNKVIFILTSFQDEDYFSSVISYDYETFSYSSAGDTITHNLVVDIQPQWELDLVKFVGLVQSFSDDNILQAREMSVPLNNLMVMDSQITGVIDEDGGDGDGVANPGEDVYLSVDIYNNSMELYPTSTNISITSLSSDINILESEFQHEIVIESGEYYNMQIPISISEDIPLGVTSFVISLESSYIDNYGNNLVYTNSYERELQVNLYQQGFPYIVNTQVISSPAVIDIDQDGIKDIIFGDYMGLLHVIDIFGNEKFGFPFDLGDQIWASPSVFDIDLDGDIEIITCSKNKKIHAINSDGSEQFSYNTGKYLIGTPALGDIDGDSDLEIIVGSYDSPTSSNKIYAINPDGSDVDGFPVTIGEKIKIGVALADFNENDKVDIVIGTDNQHIYLVYDSGEIADGFPFEADADFRSEPIVLEYNSSKIIMAGTKDGTFYGINQNGETIFTINTSDDIMSSPSILSFEDELIVMFGNDDGELYAINPDGSALEGWPMILPGSIVSSPAFSDFNSDGIPEIVVSLDDGSLYVLNLDGTYFDNTPFNYPFPYTSSSTIEDLDSDGDLEILCGTSDGVNVFDIKQSGTNSSYWNTFRGNYKRDGFYQYIIMGDVNQDNNTDILDIVIVLNYVLGNIDFINIEYADYNGDGEIDVTDIILLLNEIMEN